MKKIASIILAISAISLSGCGDGKSKKAKNAEFRTLNQCLEGVKGSARSSLDIVTNRPDEVSGFLSNGEGFACQKKVSGTKGIYYHGWYGVK